MWPNFAKSGQSIWNQCPNTLKSQDTARMSNELHRSFNPRLSSAFPQWRSRHRYPSIHFQLQQMSQLLVHTSRNPSCYEWPGEASCIGKQLGSNMTIGSAWWRVLLFLFMENRLKNAATPHPPEYIGVRPTAPQAAFSEICWTFTFTHLAMPFRRRRQAMAKWPTCRVILENMNWVKMDPKNSVSDIGHHGVLKSVRTLENENFLVILGFWNILRITKF